MSDLSFGSPWLLLLLPAVLVLAALPYWWKGRMGPAGMRYADTNLVSGRARSLRLRAMPFVPVLRFLALALVIVAAARPQVADAREVIRGEGVDIAIALDISVTFGWDDPGDPSITHYKALRRVGDSGGFTTIEENTGSTDTSYTDTTASAETGYEYRVVAVNGGGDSPEPDSLTAETLPEPTPTIAEVIEPEPEDDPIAERQVNLDDEKPDAPRLHVDGEPQNHKE